jgi:hypothetical protein
VDRRHDWLVVTGVTLALEAEEESLEELPESAELLLASLEELP